jgi:hypothetical protein
LTHPDVGYSQAEDLIAAEGAVETRVLRRQGENCEVERAGFELSGDFINGVSK